MFNLCKSTKKRTFKLRHLECPFLCDGKCHFGQRYPEASSPCPFGGHLVSRPLPWYGRWFQSAGTKPRHQLRDYICLEALLGLCSHEKRTQLATGMVYCARGMHLKVDKVRNQKKLDKIAAIGKLTLHKALLAFQCPQPEPCTKDNDCLFGHQQLSSLKLHPLASLLCRFLSDKCTAKRMYSQSAQDPTSGSLLTLRRCLYGLHPTTAQLDHPEHYLATVRLILRATTLTDCAICLESFNGSCKVLFKKMRHQECCRHYFHTNCYAQWRRPQRHVSCPTCRVDSWRTITWPKLFVSEAEKQLVFTLQKECFGLVDVLPECRVLLGPEQPHSDTPSQRILVAFDDPDSILLWTLLPVHDRPAEPPRVEDEAPEAEPQPYHVYFHPENCEHYLTLQTYWIHHRSKMRCTGTLVCPTCGTKSRFVLLWPKKCLSSLLKELILNLQKTQLQVLVPSHDPTVIIKQHQDGRFITEKSGGLMHSTLKQICRMH